MFSVKSIKPYSLKVDAQYIYVTLDCCSFTISINNADYQFTPAISNVIKVNRYTKKIQNTEALFSFQSEKNITHISMAELICLPEFLYQLEVIVKPFYKEHEHEKEVRVCESEQNTLTRLFIEELEYNNLKLLIDQALDKRDEEMFYQLTKYLSEKSLKRMSF